MPDAEIDYSDIPRQTQAVKWTRPGELVSSENKQQVTLRLDAEVLSFSREQASATKAASMLKEYLKAHRKLA